MIMPNVRSRAPAFFILAVSLIVVLVVVNVLLTMRSARQLKTNAAAVTHTGTQRRFVLNAYRSFLARVCRAKPVLIVIEDLHCADDSSLWLFRHLTLGLSSLRCLVYATYRGGETVRKFARSSGLSKIELRMLSEAEVGDLLFAINGEPAPPALVLLVFQLTEGNPFQIEELLSLLNSEGRLFDSAGGWTPTAGPDWVDLPARVRVRLNVTRPVAYSEWFTKSPGRRTVLRASSVRPNS